VQKKLSELYSAIDKKVKGGEYTNLQEFLYHVEEFKKSFSDECQVSLRDIYLFIVIYSEGNVSFERTLHEFLGAESSHGYPEIKSALFGKKADEPNRASE
jgi:hypothetical protein